MASPLISVIYFDIMKGLTLAHTAYATTLHPIVAVNLCAGMQL